MASSAGTLELVARQLGLALEILEDDLAGGASAFLAELGLQPPEALAAHPDLVSATDGAAATAGELAPLIAQLTAAIDNDDVVQIIATGATLVAKIDDVLAAVDRIATALDAAASGLTPAQRAAVEAFAAELPRRLLDHVIVEQAVARAPAAVGALDALGLIERTPVDQIPGDVLHPDHIHRVVHWDRFPLLLTNPRSYLQTVYQWGDPGFDGIRLFETLQRYLEQDMGMPAVLLRPPGQAAILEAYLFNLRVDRTTAPPSGVADLRFRGNNETFTRTYPLRPPWEIRVTATGSFVHDVHVQLRPSLSAEITPPSSTVDVAVTSGLVAESEGAPLLIMGAAGGTRFEAASVALVFDFAASWNAQTGHAAGRPGVAVQVGGGRLAIDLDGADGFLTSVLPGALELEVDFSATWNPDDGLQVQGGSGLRQTVPLAVDVGPARLERLDLRLGITETNLSLEARLAAGTRLGPLAVSVAGAGAAVDLAFTRGNLGPFDLSFKFLAPSGLGLVIDAGPVSGGGSIDFDEVTGRYSGALELRLQQVNVRAVALLDTRLPGGQRGFSLLVMLSARFTAGIQLGFGITLTGVGGLVGVNRRIDLDALRERFAAGTVGRILAPEDPLRDLPAVLTELSAIFPPAEGVFVVGPTLQLQWVKLVTLDVGVFLEFPGPNRVVVLGTARASIAHPRAAGPLLRLRCDFVGVLDLAQRTFAFDAVLLDSRLLESFPITGGLMVRVGWGDAPYVLFSAGGFHPDFAPGSLVLPKTLTRLALSSGSPNDKLFLRLEGYFAITPNTVQFGAKVEVGVELGPFRAKGFLGFDALIRFEPFFFQISFKAGMRLEWRGRTLAGITVSGTLSGPGPVRFTGRACIEMLFFDICGSASFELGSDAPPTVNPVSSAVGVIAEELRLPANLRALAEDPAVTLGTVPQSTPPILAPTGIIWEQTRAPLTLLLERFEGSPLGRAEQVQINGEAVSGEERDWFAPGSFAELSDAEALTRRSFERLPSGIRLAAGDDDRSNGLPHEVEVEEFRVPTPPTPPGQRPAFEAPTWLIEAAQVREGQSNGPPPTPTIVVNDEQWQVHDQLGQPLTTTNETQAHQLARAQHTTAIPAGDLITMNM